ncbi:hypothetical protein DV495_001148 [Geotrichum candidum]|uniref:Receptor L-domain domain-containing protein n=1 Tax=Geotrichum candidum TaxID=1173061 RepID=A0A0J9X2V3_GEOCN|nr:hypothetical protein DV452_001849 [Geotrichum candidum]KAF5132564.1 hypothetical protein DV495_001148 [Geotrichum candidum]KAF7499014.1 hypothetical protein DV113_002947 [Geotrichum candidum]KAI8135517.1 hypothetical protein DUD61_000885 [Geotrichum candidum]CDO51444.1 similar to Saccharomyces cerevisiae YBR078W ECM33 GPI-anchored protein of unknown function [Geotrichum candidum]
MHFNPLVLPLALASLTAAQSSSNVCRDTLTASSQADLDTIASCTNFEGDIILASPIESANIRGVTSISGSLVARNVSSLQTLSAPNLRNISESLSLEILRSLNTVTLPRLAEVGDISLVTLNALNGVSLEDGITKAKSLIISDTTIRSLDGLDLRTVDTLNINNNRFLTTLNFNLESVSNILDFSSTGNNVEVNFPFLVWANNITLRDINSVSLPNVTKINSTLSFTNNTIESISLPKLKDVGGSLAIVSNSQLVNATFPKLESIGGAFLVVNNTELPSILGFPALSSIGGAIEFTGSFDNATLPELSVVRGGVSIESDSEEFNCSSWNEAQQDSVIRGDSYQCKGASVSTSVAISETATGTERVASNTAASATTTADSASSSNGAGAMEYSAAGALAALVFQLL